MPRCRSSDGAALAQLFVRLAWLLFFVDRWCGWPSSEGMTITNVSTPHTAVMEIKGEIASDAEASAELVIDCHARRF